MVLGGLRSREILDEAFRESSDEAKLIIATASGDFREEDQACADEHEVPARMFHGEV